MSSQVSLTGNTTCNDEDNMQWDPNMRKEIDSDHVSAAVGYDNWVAKRREWTLGHKLYLKDKKLIIEDPTLQSMSSESKDIIYENLSKGKKFSVPKPLYFVIEILVHAWKRDGLWEPPKDQINFDLPPE